MIRNQSRATGAALQELKTKEETLVASIVRNGKIIIPSGSDKILQGDRVIVITQIRGLKDIDDILAK